MKKINSQLVQLLLLAAILVMANLLSGGFFSRIDLTEENRYSLTDLTENTMDSLDAIMNVRVYLGGELPMDVQRFKETVEATLAEMKVEAGDYLQYQFIDLEGQNQLKRELIDKGVIPVEVQSADESSFTSEVIFPAALINYRGEEEIVNLLQYDCFSPGPNRLVCDYTKAEAELEYKLISAIRRLVTNDRRLIGFLTSNMQYNLEDMDEFISELGRTYQVLEVKIDSGEAIPSTKKFLPDSIQQRIKGDGFDVLIVPQPEKPFTERQKYEIDQFLMRGGRLLWVMDMSRVDHNLFQQQETVLSEPRRLNLDDLLFNYGVKIKPDLVQDMNAYVTEILVELENRARIDYPRWRYFPVVNTFEGHTITQNLDAVCFRYASSIDTLSKDGLTHTPVVTSSKYSRSLSSPVEINLQRQITQTPPPEVFLKKGNRTLALVTEGTFTSLFKGREIPTDEAAPEEPTARFVPKTPIPNKMMVIADGDMLLPDFLRGRDNMPFDNLAFLMNSVDYLINDTTYREVRAKNISARVLNNDEVEQKGELYRVLNLIGPVLLLAGVGLVRFALRRRKNKQLKQQ